MIAQPCMIIADVRKDGILMKSENTRMHEVNGPALRSQTHPETAVASMITTVSEKHSPPDQSSGTPSTQSPQEFYATFTRHPKIRQILAELAKR